MSVCVGCGNEQCPGLPEPHPSFVVIVGATPQLQILHRGLPTIRKRDDMMEFKEAVFLAAASRTHICALAPVAGPHFAAN
jgi:hypothetical protein